MRNINFLYQKSLCTACSNIPVKLVINVLKNFIKKLSKNFLHRFKNKNIQMEEIGNVRLFSSFFCDFNYFKLLTSPICLFYYRNIVLFVWIIEMPLVCLLFLLYYFFKLAMFNLPLSVLLFFYFSFLFLFSSFRQFYLIDYVFITYSR